MLGWFRDYLRVGDRSWAVRRRWTLALTAFSCAVIWVCTTQVSDTARATQIVSHMVWLIATIWPAYVLGATAETVLNRRAPAAPAAPAGPAE